MVFSTIYFLFSFATIWTQIVLAEDAKFRLPDTHIPTSYDLTLTMTPDNKTFSGQVIIEVETKEKTKQILLHSSSSRINITRIMVNYVFTCDSSYPNRTTQILDISCKSALDVGNNKIIIYYNAVYGVVGAKDQFSGFYKSSYDTDEGVKTYAITQFESTFARTAFPCFDEPRFKAKFHLTVNHPDNYVVLSNTAIQTQIKSGNG